MIRKTVMQRQTEIFVLEERLAPRKEAIKRRVKLEKGISAGINLGVMILIAAVFVKVGFVVYETLMSRGGGIGGEILVLPSLVLAFYWGHEFGMDAAEKEAKAIEDHGGEY